MSGEGDARAGYIEAATRALICRRCGALVDAAFTPEHDRDHAARVDTMEAHS